jgi:hypothetical protein
MTLSLGTLRPNLEPDRGRLEYDGAAFTTIDRAISSRRSRGFLATRTEGTSDEIC